MISILPIVYLLAEKCPKLQILDISDYHSRWGENHGVNELIAANKNLYEIRGLTSPLTPAQIRILKNRYIQHLIRRANEIAATTGILKELALLTMEYDHARPDYITDKVTDQAQRLWTLETSLRIKAWWDLAKIWSITAATFVLAVALFSLVPFLAGFSLPGIVAMKAIFAAALSNIVFKKCSGYINKRNDDLRDAVMVEVPRGANPIEQTQMDIARHHGQQSVTRWSPYFQYCLLRAKNQLVNSYDDYWRQGQVAGVIEAYPVTVRRRREGAAL